MINGIADGIRQNPKSGIRAEAIDKILPKLLKVRTLFCDDVKVAKL
jgi:hypothetical protein